MLNNEQRQRLRAEEIFRQEVRRDIEARVQDRSRRAKFWHALNTPFVLWVLSSIVVGSFGWASQRSKRHGTKKPVTSN
jgi:hypothetical protein